MLDGYPSGNQWGYVHQNVAQGAWVTVENNLAFMGRWSTNGSYDLKISAYTSSTQNTIIYNNSGVQINGTTLTKSLSLTTTDNIETIPLHFFARYDFYKKSLEYGSCKFKSFYLKNNGTLVRDMIPCKRDNDNMVGMYDLVNDMFYYPPNYTSYQLVAGPIATGTTVYPVYYDEIQDPPDNLSFSSMTEAESYECPYVGMIATIDGVKYIFSGDSQSGYEWVEYSRLPTGYTEVEYIRQNSNYNAYINTGVIIFDNTTNTYTITTRLTSEFHSNLGCATIISCERVNSPYDGLGYRYKCSSTVNQLEFFGANPNYTSSVVDNGDGTKTVTFQSSGNSSFTTDVPLSYMAAFSSTTYGANAGWRYSDTTIYSATIVKNGVTVRDFVPAKRNSDSVYGLYDLITDTFYTSPNGNNFIGGDPV